MYDFMTVVITAGSLAALLLEGVKGLVRWIKKNPVYDFSKSFYKVMIPCLSFAVQPFLAWLGIVGYSMPADFVGWIKSLIMVVISSLISMIAYDTAIKQFKYYSPYR